MANKYSVGEFANLVGLSVSTLQRWDREGVLVADRTPTNQRQYTQEHLRDFFGSTKERKNVLYCRVSSPSQRDDLSSQVKAMEEFCLAGGISISEIIKEFGGGMNMGRPKFRYLIKDILDGNVDKVVIAHKDRLMRFGFDLFLYLCDLRGTDVIIANQESLSPQEEMVQDLLTIVHTFSCRLYGLRKYKKRLKNELSA